jgi:DNA-binding CsgD family transcriptional regulator
MWLRSSDLEAVLSFLADLNALEPAEPYPNEMFDRLQALIPCDGAAYQDADLETRAFVTLNPADSPEDDALYWAVGPCPIMEYRSRTGDLTAVRMSDVISRNRYHDLPFYREYFQPVSLDHVLDLGLSAVNSRFRSLLFLRGHDVPDFSERDRAVLEILRPHLWAREAIADLHRRAAEAASSEDTSGPTAARSSLTPREREIVHLVAAGKTNAEIAAELWVTPGTVKKHLENVYAKLGVGSRAAAASRVGSTPGIAASSLS